MADLRPDIRAFFDEHVRPNYDEWMAKPLDQRLAKNSVGDANNMAERVFHYWDGIDQEKLYDQTRPGDYRQALAAEVCPDFQLVNDVADAHKHFTLGRSSRQITRSDQTSPGSLGWDVARWGEGLWGSPEQLVVQLDDGSRRPLEGIMGNVIAMWEALLADWGL